MAFVCLESRSHVVKMDPGIILSLKRPLNFWSLCLQLLVGLQECTTTSGFNSNYLQFLLGFHESILRFLAASFFLFHSIGNFSSTPKVIPDSVQESSFRIEGDTSNFQILWTEPPAVDWGIVFYSVEFSAQSKVCCWFNTISQRLLLTVPAGCVPVICTLSQTHLFGCFFIAFGY